MSLDRAESRDTKQQYVYDAWNRLTEVKDAAGVTVARYVYDGLHRRVERRLYTGGELSATYHDYYNLAWQLLETRKDSASTPYEQYVWDLRYIDAPVQRQRDTDSNGQLDETLYYLNDANMNVTALTDTSGAVVERYDYDPYGKVSFLDASWGSRSASSYDNSMLFGGYRYDSESGLYHVRYRMYHPTLGRWLQRDPLGYLGGMSLYHYGRSQPTFSIDPFGLMSADEGWASCHTPYCERVKAYKRAVAAGMPVEEAQEKYHLDDGLHDTSDSNDEHHVSYSSPDPGWTPDLKALETVGDQLANSGNMLATIDTGIAPGSGYSPMELGAWGSAFLGPGAFWGGLAAEGLLKLGPLIEDLGDWLSEWAEEEPEDVARGRCPTSPP